MTEKTKATSAILAVFPTPETLRKFIENNENKSTFESFIAYAARNNVIESDNESDFKDFIKSNRFEPENCTPPKNLTLEELLEKKEKYLNIDFSVRGLTDRINTLIDDSRIELPKISNTMFTRLKKEAADTPHKLNTLRSLAFWFGHERSNLNISWNYETLFALCNRIDQPVDYKEGVRIAFSLYSRGDAIGGEIVDWLKKELKEYIKYNITLIPQGHWGKVKFHDITTMYIDFPKEKGNINPAAYLQCIRNAISIAHQITIEWALTNYCSNKRFLAIGIAAGDFSSIDNYLLPILNAKLPDDPVIRMTDFARQCILINGIRTIFCDRPKELVMFNGEPLNIWWVVGLWSTIYWDFVPGLLKADILKNTPAASDTLRGLLLFPGTDSTKTINGATPNVMSTFFRFPNNSLLGIEIAKTLYYRRRFWEANEVLRIVLSINPLNLNARSLRMAIYRNMAIEAPSYSAADLLFRRAEKEAACIRETTDEDFYDEYAIVKLAKALTILNIIRENKGEYKTQNICLTQANVYELLDEAEDLLINGITVSPNGLRSIYFYMCTKMLEMILKNDEEIFKSPDKLLNCPKRYVTQIAVDMGVANGFLSPDHPERILKDIGSKVYLSSFKNHYESMSLSAYHPNIHYALAVSFWDFNLTRDSNNAQIAKNAIKSAISITRELEKDDVCVFSFTRLLGEMMPTEQYIDHMQKALQVVESWNEGSEDDDRLICTLNI
ncbi:MAG: hypothetical protein GY847_39215 [Proteobacteria bacterium]|nr:hypothetical protein [Pseudomonadota bacterium]